MTNDNSKASAEVQALLLDLDAEFGKQPRIKKGITHKELNAAWHAANPTIKFARGQVDSLKFENYYDWQMHKQHLHQIEAAQNAGVPELQWLPEAIVTYVIHQQCACCKETTTFIGREYVRFRGRRRQYRDLQGVHHWTYPTMLKEVGKVDGNLLMYGLPGGEPLPDLMEELQEVVRRCHACINLEKGALDLWISSVQPSPQGDILDAPAATKATPSTTLSGNQLKAFAHREFGERFKKPSSTALEIDIPLSEGEL